MFKNHLHSCLVIFLFCLLISACSQLGLQSKKETSEPSSLPECKKNYTKEGIWPFNRVYKTWVKYDPLDYKKGYDAAVTTIKTRGYRMITSDRQEGTISAEMTFGTGDPKTYPVDIMLVKEKTSLTVYLSSKSASGDSGQDCFCDFYKGFEKSVKRTSPASQPKQTSLPPKALPKTQVVWPSSNIREGPGTKYKIVGKVKKGATLAILEEKEGWLHVRLEDGKEAWVSKSATSMGVKTPPAPSPSPPPSPPSSATPSSPKPKSPM